MTAVKPTPSQMREINETIRYAMWSVFRVGNLLPQDHLHRDRFVNQLRALFAELESEGAVLRAMYDVSGLRADADLMLWFHAERVETLQAAYQRFRRTDLGRHLTPVWSAMALHRPAEFNSSHVPAFLTGEAPGQYICVYPFVRSYDWYLLPEAERRAMLVEHGQLARGYPDVRANTVASFALNDYEWVLAFESDELHRIVDLMRDLRASRARMHVREEVPFFTGRRVELTPLVMSLP
jgi:chlorite dismutase